MGDPGAAWAEGSRHLVALRCFERADMAFRLVESGQLELAEEVAEVALTEAAAAGRSDAWVAFRAALAAELELLRLLERERSPAEHERFEALLARQVARAGELGSARAARLAADRRARRRALALTLGAVLVISIVIGLVIAQGS